MRRAVLVRRPANGRLRGGDDLKQDPAKDEGAAVGHATSGATSKSRYRDALRHRDLRILLTSLFVDQIGSWSYLVVLSVYVFDRTHSPQWLAALAICRWGPGLLLASYGGVIADRYQRTTVMFVSTLASTILMIGMAVVVAAKVPVGFVLAVAALAAVALIPYRPAVGALTPDIVAEKDLAAANSLISGVENLVVVIGPAIGGLLLLAGQPVIGVVINAVTFVAAAVLTKRLRVRSAGGGGAEGNLVQQWAAGFRALAAQRFALALIMFAALDSAVYGACTVLFAPLSVRLGTGTSGYSYLLAGVATGGVLGLGLANRLISASRLAPVVMGSFCLMAVPFLVTIPVRSPVLAFLLQVVSGTGMVVVDVLVVTILQRDVPGSVLSRVLGICDTIVLAGILLASLIIGVVLAHTSITVALVAIGAGIPILGLAGLPTLLRADRMSAAVSGRLRQRVRLLSELDLLADANRSVLERLAAAAQEVDLPPGEVLIREGDQPDYLWILASGELLVRTGDGLAARELPPVTAPGYVGELGLLHSIPRTATVRTSQECSLLRIDGQEFLSALEDSRPSPALLSLAGTRLNRGQSQTARNHPEHRLSHAQTTMCQEDDSGDVR
jgi:CRP-like cAMP-binding protein/predicted MFS family arabinose efflux permease